jgi:AcrR family transcriptional regulator
VSPDVKQVDQFPHGKVPRAVRERQILALAEELFAERGYDRASMDELARRAGVSKPVIYDLVGSKEALFRRCFEFSGEELAQRVAAAAAEHEGDLGAELRASARAFFRFVEEHDSVWSMLFSLDTGGRTASAVAAIRTRQADFVVARLRARGVRADERRLRAVATIVNGAFEALANWRHEDPSLSTDDLADWLADFVQPGIEALLR